MGGIAYSGDMEGAELYTSQTQINEIANVCAVEGHEFCS